MDTGKRRFRSVLSIAVVISSAGLLLGTGAAAAAGNIDVFAPGNQWCVSEDGRDGAGNENACTDGKGLGNDVSALQVSPDGKRVFAAGYDSFNGAFAGDSITTYDRERLGGALTLDSRVNACRARFVVEEPPKNPGCSLAGNQAAYLASPTGIAVSPDSGNVYVSANKSLAVTVFDYVAFPGADDPLGEIGPLSRKAQPNACVSENALVGCSDSRGLARAFDVVVAPDGETVYTAGNDSTHGGIGVFDRASDGVLTQKVGLAGCLNDSGFNGCADAANLEPVQLSISADGENLYAASEGSDAARDTVTVFDINADGTITQKAGLSGCFSDGGSGGECTNVPGLLEPQDVSVTPDGKHVFVASVDGHDPGAVKMFSRDVETGALTAVPGEDGCFNSDGSGDCIEANGLYRPFTLLATNEAVYVGSNGDNESIPGALSVFDRDEDDGSLTQSIPSGCWARQTIGNCRTLPTIENVRAISVSPDGNNLYVGAGSVTVFDRDNGEQPVTSIDSGPSGETTATSATFTFSADKAVSSFQCGFDFEFFECTSPQTFENLSPGPHTFEVVAFDRFHRGDFTKEVRTFTVVAPPTCETDGSLCPPPTCEEDPSLCPGPPDTKVEASVTAAKVQKIKGQKIVVAVKVSAGEDLAVKATGSIKKGKRKAAFKPVSQALKAGTTTTLKLRPAKAKAGRLVAAALLGSKRTVPKLLITLTDGATNRSTSTPKVTIKGRPR